MKKVLRILGLVALASADIQSDSLALHNNERNAYGVPSVTWSTTLAASAQAYAETMASTGTTSHSTNRVHVGENLAWGSGSSISVTSLGNLWIKEKQDFIPGTDFPGCSTTGSWHDVAHYTQLMWEKTTQIGCGLAQSSSGRYNYVCQYSPQGNMNGELVYTVGSSSSSPSTSSSSSSPSSSTGSASTQPSTGATTSTPQSNSNNNQNNYPQNNHHHRGYPQNNNNNEDNLDNSNNNNNDNTGATSQPATTSQPTTTTTTTSQPSSSSSSSSPASTSVPAAASSSQFITDCLNAHNTERNNYGIPSLVWDTSLASTAQAYAQVMVSTGTTSHSTNRVNVGENLAWGSGSSTSTTQLIGLWLAEKQFYVPGTDFPYVSTTARWSDVAHYTQMMWEQTTAVGCGIAQASSGRYNLVCHYYVQGNIDGEPVYTVGVSPISSSPSSSSSSSPSSSSSSSTGSTSTQPTTGTTITTPQTNTISQPSSLSSSFPSPSTSAPAASSSQFVTDSLNAHNTERNNYGVPSLVWNTSLAQTAQAYAQVMASSGTTSHSTGRVNVGENLAWGSGKSITTTHLIGLWIAEKQYFIPGTDFPDCTTTGSWHDVAHYTAMMWRKTTDVGCGIAQAGSGRYNLVCHYYVHGNINGNPVY